MKLSLLLVFCLLKFCISESQVSESYPNPADVTYVNGRAPADLVAGPDFIVKSAPLISKNAASTQKSESYMDSFSATPTVIQHSYPVAVTGAHPIPVIQKTPVINSVPSAPVSVPVHAPVTQHHHVPIVQHVPVVQNVPAIANIPVTHVQEHHGIIHKTVNVAQPAIKSRKYEVRRPAIQKQFYDIEERIIIRPAGTVLLELEQPVSKRAKDEEIVPIGGYNGQTAGLGSYAQGGVVYASADARTTSNNEHYTASAHTDASSKDNHQASIKSATSRETPIHGGQSNSHQDQNPHQFERSQNENYQVTEQTNDIPQATQATPQPGFHQRVGRPLFTAQSTDYNQYQASIPGVTYASAPESHQSSDISRVHQGIGRPLLARKFVEAHAPQSYLPGVVYVTNSSNATPSTASTNHRQDLSDNYLPQSDNSGQDIAYANQHDTQYNSAPTPVTISTTQSIHTTPATSTQQDDNDSVVIEARSQQHTTVDAGPKNNYSFQIVTTNNGAEHTQHSVGQSINAKSNYNSNSKQIPHMITVGEPDFKYPPYVEVKSNGAAVDHNSMAAAQLYAHTQHQQLRGDIPPTPNNNEHLTRVAVQSKSAATRSYSSSHQLSPQQSALNQKQFIDLLLQRGAVSEIGYGSTTHEAHISNVGSSGKGVLRTRVIAATPAPYDAEPTGERVHTRRIVVSHPIETVEEVIVHEPVTNYQQVTVQQPTIYKTATVGLKRVETAVPVYVNHPASPMHIPYQAQSIPVVQQYYQPLNHPVKINHYKVH